jgi:UDP-glucose 4-epimerase
MRVLITGGAGFIGSNLAAALASGGHDLCIVDNLSTGRRENLSDAAVLEEVDILDDAFMPLVRRFRPDALVHLAAQASVTESIRDPERDWAVNAEGTRRVALAAREVGAARVLSASSAAVYGEPSEADLPLAEHAPKGPVNPYGRSKLAAESLLSRELDTSGVDWASLRFSNVYGPKQDGLGEGGVVAVFCQRLLDAAAPVVFGDGTQTRDFIFVGDIVAAIVSALSFEGSLALGEGDASAYNISTGRESSVNDLLQALGSAAGRGIVPEHRPARDGDVMRSSLDSRKASERFGWSASESLADGVAATWAWCSARG